MERYYAGSPRDRYKFVCDQDFRIYTSVEGVKAALVGPRASGVRALSYLIPPGCDGLIIDADADADIECTYLPNRSRENLETRYRVESVAEEEPLTMMEQVKRAMAALYGSRQVESTDPPSDPDWEDDDYDPHLAPWEHIAVDAEDEPYPDEALSETPPEAEPEALQEPESVPPEPKPSPPEAPA